VDLAVHFGFFQLRVVSEVDMKLVISQSMSNNSYYSVKSVLGIFKLAISKYPENFISY